MTAKKVSLHAQHPSSKSLRTYRDLSKTTELGLKMKLYTEAKLKSLKRHPIFFIYFFAVLMKQTLFTQNDTITDSFRKFYKAFLLDGY